MADRVPKLNSMRFLEAHHVEYEVYTYDESITDGVKAAQAMELPPSQVYKTLVVQLKDGEHALVMIPSDHTLDLKRFARSIGQKRASMTTKRGAEAATGLKTGGIGALAPNRKSDLARLGLKAVAAGTMANFMSAAIAGMLL